MYQANVYNVMVASPGDVAEERRAVRSAIGRWNDLHAGEKGIVLLPIGWDTHAYPELGTHPQDVVNKQVASRADIVVAVFGARIGTPTREHLSGTVEEIEEAIAADKPVLVYFSSGDIKRDALDVEQYTKLEDFRKNCRSRGLCAEYDSADALQARLQDDLLRLANDKLRGYSPPERGAAGPYEAHEPGLSDHAKRLLKTAAESRGEIYRLRVLGGARIQIGSIALQLDEGRDGTYWEGAVEELEAGGYIKDKGTKGEILGLTRQGYEIADKLGSEWILKPQGNGPAPSANSGFPTLTTPQLSDEARRLLKTAAGDDGEILKVAHRRGLQIRVGNGVTLDLERGKQAAVWESAIGELEEEGLLEAKGHKGNLFSVTRKGYEYAEEQLGDEWLLTQDR